VKNQSGVHCHVKLSQRIGIKPHGLDMPQSREWSTYFNACVDKSPRNFQAASVDLSASVSQMA
jgi:hypothetical protein